MGRAFEVRKFAKEKTGKAKAKLFSKYGKEIYVAAKSGADPANNDELQRVIDKARKEQVPNNIIERAIKKATSNDTENYFRYMCEGFLNGGVNVIVDCLTDNNNRTYSNIKDHFTKSGGKLGVNGSVMHMFNHNAIFSLKGLNEDSGLEFLINNDIEAEDMLYENETLTILASAKDFGKIKKALKKLKNIQIVSEEIGYLPLNEIELNKENMESFKKLYDLLEDDDDVQNIYHNVSNVE